MREEARDDKRMLEGLQSISNVGHVVRAQGVDPVATQRPTMRFCAPCDKTTRVIDQACGICGWYGGVIE